MIELSVPGRGQIQIEHLVCDVNGTLALDGRLIDGVAQTLGRLRGRVQVHLVTANTHGLQGLIDQELQIESVILQQGDEAGQKARFVQRLGADHTAVIGNGANDAGMLAAAALAICVLSPEGLSLEALQASDVLVPDIRSALELIEKPLRIVATLRK
jgi:soluble P-type ATPase